MGQPGKGSKMHGHSGQYLDGLSDLNRHYEDANLHTCIHIHIILKFAYICVYVHKSIHAFEVCIQIYIHTFLK